MSLFQIKENHDPNRDYTYDVYFLKSSIAGFHRKELAQNYINMLSGMSEYDVPLKILHLDVVWQLIDYDYGILEYEKIADSKCKIKLSHEFLMGHIQKGTIKEATIT